MVMRGQQHLHGAMSCGNSYCRTERSDCNGHGTGEVFLLLERNNQLPPEALV